jgi:hypothetical protein
MTMNARGRPAEAEKKPTDAQNTISPTSGVDLKSDFQCQSKWSKLKEFL